jgi:hypothetical protein
MLDARLRAGGRAEFAFPAAHNAAILVMQGEVTLNGRRAAANDFVLFANEGERVAVAAEAEAQLLVLAGEPIAEPVVAYGPFVMNTRAELVKAFEDYQAGRLGIIPAVHTDVRADTTGSSS